MMHDELFAKLGARKLVSASTLGSNDLPLLGQPASAVPTPRSASPAAAIPLRCPRAFPGVWQSGLSPDVQAQGLVPHGHILPLGGHRGCAASARRVHNVPGRSRDGGPVLRQWTGSPEENMSLLSRNFLG